MKKLPSVKAILLALIVICSMEILTNRMEQLTILSLDSSILTSGSLLKQMILVKSREKEIKEDQPEIVDLRQEIEIVNLKASTPTIVFEGMTLEELASKLDRSLKSTLSGYGMSFAKYSLDYHVDPYLVVAITLHETGCAWNCSSLVQKCNNVGGMKGQGNCNGGAYATFASLDEGIEAMVSNLSRNYIDKGLTTPEAIGKKYAGSSTWATKINNYITKIRNA